MNSIIDIDRVLEELTAETGLDDFGDPTYHDGLDTLVATLTDEARLSDAGHVVAVGQITSMLKTRLLVEQWWSDHPELDEEHIEAPIFIVGLLRSGTTALSHLRARSRNRSLLGWEASLPVPPPRRSTYATDARFEAAKQTSSGFSTSSTPRSRRSPRSARPAGRVPRPMAQHFVALSLPLMYPIPTYRGGCTPSITVRCTGGMNVCCDSCSGRRPRRWRLKSPRHSIALEALTAQDPEPITVTHRDPATCVASTASLASSSRAHSRTPATLRSSVSSGLSCSWLWPTASSSSGATTATIASSTFRTPN